MVSMLNPRPDGDADVIFRLRGSRSDRPDNPPPAHLPRFNLAWLRSRRGRCRPRAPDRWPTEIDGWNKYPPNQGIPDLNLAIANGLGRRYRIPQGLLDPAQQRHPDRGAARKASTSSPPWRRLNRRAGASPIVGAAQPASTRPISAAPCCLGGRSHCSSMPMPETGFPARLFKHRRGYVAADGRGLSLLARQSAGRDRQPSTICMKLLSKCRQHDAVLAVVRVLRRDLTPAILRSAGLEAALAMDTTGGKDPFRNVAVFHSAQQALQRRRPSLRLHGGRSKAGGRCCCAGGPMAAADPLRRPEGVGGAMARGDASARGRASGTARTSASPNRSCTTASATFTPGGGFFLWLDVGDGEDATRRLWSEAHLKVLPGSYVCRETQGINTAERYIRVALVHDEKTTREAMTRLAAVL